MVSAAPPQSSLQYYEELFNGISLSIITLTPRRETTGTVPYFLIKGVNRQWELTNGRLAADVVGRSLGHVFPALADGPLYPFLLQLAQTGEPFQTTESQTLAGETRWYELRGFCIGDDLVLSANDITPHWQAQRALEQNSELLRSVLDGSQNHIIAFDAIRDAAGHITDFRYILQNEANRRSVNRTEEEVIGHTMLEYFPNVIGTGLFDRYVRVIETGQPDRFEIPYFYDGLTDYFDISVVKRGDGMVLTLHNKTEAWLADQRARRQSELFQRVVDHSPAGLVLAEAVRSPEGKITDFRYQLTNTRNAQLAGRSVDEMVGRLIGDFFPGWQSLPLFQTFCEVTETGVSQQYTFESFRYTARAWLEGSFQKQGDGLLFTYLDVSDLKKAHMEQAVQAARLEAILNNSQTAISLHEAIRNEQHQVTDFRTTLANRLATDKWGLVAGETLRGATAHLTLGSLKEKNFHRLLQVMETGEATVFEANNDYCWSLIAVARLNEGLVISVTDITEIHRYREQLETTNRELKRSNESLQQFAYVASHDLQEPLRKILAFGDMINDLHSEALGPGGSDLVDRMRGSARRMSQLIRDLLNYSRVSTLKDPFSPVDLNTILRDVQGDLEVRIHDAGAKLHIDPLPTVSGSAMQLQQLFQNLLSNAIKFGRKGQPPQVRVRCESDDTGPRPAGLSAAGAYWQISIEDNGIGFDSQYSERIFQVFQRLHGKNQFSGTGVGLAICQKVAENHGGAIVASSQRGEGATFTVWLPRHATSVVNP